MGMAENIRGIRNQLERLLLQLKRLRDSKFSKNLLEIARRLRQLSSPLVKSRFFGPSILIGGALFALILLVSAPSVEPRAIVERSWHVKVIKAKREDIQPDLHVFGQVVAGREVVLRALVQGEIIETWPELREGGILRRGAPLLRIDPFNYETAVREASASLREAKARLLEMEAKEQEGRALYQRAVEQLEILQRDLDRSELLAKDGHIAEKTLDDRKLAFIRQAQQTQQRRSALAIEKARLEQQESAVKRSEITLSRRQRDMENTLLVSPYDGFLRNVRAGVGRLVSSNDPIATLVDATRLEVRFNLSERQFGDLLEEEGSLKGRRLRVSWRVGKKTLFFDAVVAQSGAEISSTTGGVDVFATLDLPSIESPIRPGAFVEVDLPDRLYKQVLRLPEEAIYQGNYVYIVKGNRLERQKIEIVGRADRDILVRSQALEEGAPILATRFPEVGPGIKVVPFLEEDAQG